jgi:hypothetical protein
MTLAHGLVHSEEVPLPFGWLVAGALAVLLVSFAMFAVAWQRPRFEEDRWRPLIPVHRAVSFSTGLVGVGLLLLTVWSGFAGTDQVGFNFSVTFVFVTVWLGLVALSVLFGDVFRAFNPWRALAIAGGWALRRLARRTLTEPVPYPERLGRWPAVAGLVAFAWLELCYTARGLPDEGLEIPGVPPETLATAVVLYSLYTFVAMAVFGVETWLRRGETFSVYFGMFASLAPFEVRDGRLGRRPWLTGAPRWAAGVPGSAALVVAAIGITVFDDARDVLVNRYWIDLWTALTDAGLDSLTARRLTNTAFMLLVLLAVAAAFRLGMAMMRRGAGRTFAHAFVPIALAYLVAHYFSFFVQQEQAQLTYLISDPLGRGWDLFGTAGHRIDFALLSDAAIWSVQVAALLAGHAVALALAHDRALATYRERADAVRSQYAMLALMVAFTLLALALISELTA